MKFVLSKAGDSDGKENKVIEINSLEELLKIAMKNTSNTTIRSSVIIWFHTAMHIFNVLRAMVCFRSESSILPTRGSDQSSAKRSGLSERYWIGYKP